MTIIQHKRGLSTNWTSSDPVLAVSEIGYETDTGKFKIGDGASAWSALPYFSTSVGGSGTVTSITAGTGLSGGTITTSGTIALSHLGIQSLTDPNADRIMFWDDSAGAMEWLTLGTNLSISGTTINATDTNTTYTAGTGLTLSGTEFSVTANTYQPLDADLTAIAALSSNGLLRKTAGTWGMDTATYLTSYTETSTLSDVTGRGATTNTAISITNSTTSTSTTTGALKVTGGVGIGENLNVGGNLAITGDLTVNGTTTTLNSTVVTVDDPIFTLGGDTAPGSDDNKDRGIAFRWHNGSAAKIGFFGFDDSTQQFTFVPDATITNEVISGSTGTISANLNGNATSSNTLSTARNLWGQSFDGSGDITGSLTSVSDITSSDTTFSIGTTSVTTISGNAITITGGTTSNTVGTGGSISLTGGSATSSTGANYGGNINIAAGASTLSTSGTGGSVSILAGNGNTKGTISIGTSNTSGITIGASGITTTVAGTLSASLNALTISSPLSGTSYNGSSAVSIGLSTGYGDTQNPYGTKSQYYVLAGPVTPTPAAPSFRLLTSGDIPDLSGDYVALSGNQTVAGSKTFTSSVQIQVAGNTGLSLGRVDGTSSVNYIDFNNGATVVDYDTRIYSSGGTGSTGGGSFTFYASSSTFTGDVTVTGGDIVLGTTGTASTIKTLATTGASSGSISISSGNTTSSGTSGNISIDAGSGATGNGSISIGTSNASAVTIGRSGVTTTINGTLSAAVDASGLTGTISGTVLGNSTAYIGTTAFALNRSSANLALTGITSITGGTGTTALTLSSANTSGAASGAVLVTSGEAASSTAGTVKVDSGNNGVPGSGGANVSIGTTNASSVTIGRAGITTTIAGTLSATVSNATDATSADTVKTVSTATNASFYPTFVDANNGTATSEAVYTDAGLVYNPSSNTLTVGGNLIVGGVSIQVEGATADSFETLLTVTDPTADRTITFPDATGTVALTSDISGFVTSVTGTAPVSSSGGTTPAISLASGYGDTQNPYGSKTTNYVLAGPAGGPSAAPSFRALVSGDIPDLSGTYVAVSGGTAPTATNANNINISTTDGNTSDTTMYPVFVAANTTGNQAPHTDVSGFTYNASTNAINTGIGSFSGDVAVNGGDLTTTAATFNLINTNATTLNIGGAATDAVNIGSSSGIINLAGSLDLRAGGTAAETAPLYFSSSSSVLTTPVAGAMEYNDKALYFTPDTTPGRALVSTPFYNIITSSTQVANLAGGTAGTVSAFGTNGIALDSGTAYEVEMLLLLESVASSNSCTLVVTPGSPSGAATPSTSEFYYDYSSSTTVITNAAALSGVLRTGTTTFPSLNTITISTGTTNILRAFVKGIMDISTGGNFTFRLAYTPGAGGSLVATMLRGSYLKITPIGAEDVSSIGTWA